MSELGASSGTSKSARPYVEKALVPFVSQTTDPFGVATLVAFDDAEALRGHLDALNEDGKHPVAVGWDATPQPFLITLVGIYVESEDVLFDSPWQTDCNYGEMVDGKWVEQPPRCDECMAQAHGIEHLRFPVSVLVTSARKGSRC